MISGSRSSLILLNQEYKYIIFVVIARLSFLRWFMRKVIGSIVAHSPGLEPVQYKGIKHLLCVSHCIHIVLRKAHISPASHILSWYMKKWKFRGIVLSKVTLSVQGRLRIRILGPFDCKVNIMLYRIYFMSASSVLSQLRPTDNSREFII